MAEKLRSYRILSRRGLPGQGEGTLTELTESVCCFRQRAQALQEASKMRTFLAVLFGFVVYYMAPPDTPIDGSAFVPQESGQWSSKACLDGTPVPPRGC